MAYLLPLSVLCEFKCADSNDIYTGTSLNNQILSGIKYENTESTPVEWSPAGELQQTDAVWYYIPTEGERSQEYHYIDLYVFADEIASPSIVEITLDEEISASYIENCSAMDSATATKSIAISISELCSTYDSASSVKTTSASITENCSASDESDGIVGNFADMAESASSTDSQSATVSFQASITENVSAGDMQDATINTSASIVETSNPSDTQDAIVTNGGELLVESANATDSFSAVVIKFASIVEIANPTDICAATIVYQVSIVESANATDSFDFGDIIGFETQMENVLFDWLLPIAGLWREGRDEAHTPRADGQPIMVWHMQAAPRSAIPILEGRISSIIKIGRDAISPPDHDGNAKISGTREFMLYLQYFGDFALDAMLKIRNACEDPEHLDILFAAGITSVEASPPIDAHEFLGTMPEDRAIMDIRFRTTMEWTANIGMPIENVLAEGVLVTGNVNDAIEIDMVTT